MALAFSSVIVLLVMKLPQIKIVSYIGRNTLLYVGIHIPVLRVFEKLFPGILSQYRFSIPFAFVLYFGLAVACALCNTLAPYVCGKKPVVNTWKHKAVKVLLVAFGAAVPYMKVLKVLNLWSFEIGAVSFRMMVLLGLSCLFVFLTERYLPIIYLEERE